ncbi:hypothetical protein [Kibdelosporangium philippinense]|uniref:hypothetical protein n=1 Tax=Kibdelosporangium philippinense TaxID=211113 RepID=UPI003621B67F
MSRSGWRLAACCVAAGLALSGCVSFAEQPRASEVDQQPELAPESGPSEGGGSGGNNGPGRGGGGGPQTPVPPPEGCKDYHPAWSVRAWTPSTRWRRFRTATRPRGLRVNASPARAAGRYGNTPNPVTTIPVDGTTDGGLTGSRCRRRTPKTS